MDFASLYPSEDVMLTKIVGSEISRRVDGYGTITRQRLGENDTEEEFQSPL